MEARAEWRLTARLIRESLESGAYGEISEHTRGWLRDLAEKYDRARQPARAEGGC